MEDNARIKYMDVFRGIGIVIMIMGHIWFGTYFDIFKAAFHMPMFFIISGFFFQHKSKGEISVGKFILKKARTLLVPYFFFGIGHFLIYFFAFGNHDWKPLIRLFSWNNDGLAITGVFWFLSALFIANLLFFLIDRYVINAFIKTTIIVIVAVSGNFLEQLKPPFSLSAAFVGVGLMYIGNLIKKYETTRFVNFLLNLKLVPFVILSAITVILIFVNHKVNMRLGEYSNPVLFWVNSTSATLLGINFSKKMETMFSKTILLKVLIEIGQYSMVYMLLNQLIIYVLSGHTDGTLIDKLIVLLLTLFVLYIISRIINNSNLRFLIGKPVNLKRMIF